MGRKFEDILFGPKPRRVEGSVKCPKCGATFHVKQKPVEVNRTDNEHEQEGRRDDRDG